MGEYFVNDCKMKVQILACTPNAELLVAKSAKLCYSNSTVDNLLDKPMSDKEVKDFVSKLSSIGHYSPIEHCSFTFAIEGVSRALTHQLVRHRLASYSQQSQRYVKEGQFEYVVPKEIRENKSASALYRQSMEEAQTNYDILVQFLMEGLVEKNFFDKLIVTSPYTDILEPKTIRMVAEKNQSLLELYGIKKSEINALEKIAIENARYVLPNACETKIVVTMNARSLVNFFEHRCCNRAQDEIRELADEMLRICRVYAPAIFNNVAPSCTYGKCKEGSMSCGKPRTDLRCK